MPIAIPEPTMLNAGDGTQFLCTVENVGGRGLRSVYESSELGRYDGGIYAGEATADAIQARFDGWWPTSLAFQDRAVAPLARRLNERDEH